MGKTLERVEPAQSGLGSAAEDGEATGVVEQRRLVPAVMLLVAAGIFGISFFLNSYRIAQTVDLKSDEATYAIESVALMRTGITRWNGGPFLVHPPLFYLIEGAYFEMLGIGDGPLFDRLAGAEGYRAGEPLLGASVALTGTSMTDAIFAGRYLSALYGAIISVLLFLLGTRLLDWRLGALAAVIFMLDPYSLWRAHFNYLEPLTALFGVLMYLMYSLWISDFGFRDKDQEQSKIRNPKSGIYLLLAGVFFGLALLTKELALIYLLPLLVHAFLFRRLRLRELAVPVLMGVAIYSIFPIWAAWHGELDNWWNSRTWLFSRISGEIRDTGVDRPGGSLGRTLAANLPDYWPWFVLLAVAGIMALVFLYLYFRHKVRDATGDLLTSLVIGSYAFFLAVRLAGGVINEHFFYLLMPMVALYIAFWTLVVLRVHRPSTLFEGKLWNRDESFSVQATTSGDPNFKQPQAGTRGLKLIFPALLGLLLLYNLAAWVGRYGSSRDDSYAQLEGGAVGRSLPVGAAVVGRDLLDLYLLPKNAVYTFSYLNLGGRSIDPANLIERSIPYAILNDQSLLEGYGGANVAYYDWVRRNGREIERFRGRLYDTSLYRIDYTGMEDVFGRESLGVGRPAVASSFEKEAPGEGEEGQFTVRYGPEQAFDARLSTRWASAETDREWIYVDLGETKRIGRVELLWEQAHARDYELQVSDDATNWRTFYSTTSGAGGQETINAGASGRYVRLNMTRRATRFGYSLWEFSIYP